MYIYFPSCNFTKLFPDTSEKIKTWIKQHGEMVTGCCRPNHKKLTDAEIPITICETCNIIIQENCPSSEPISLWEYIDTCQDFSFPDHSGETITVQDCYRAKDRTAEKTAIRNLLHKLQYTVVELSGTEEEQNFDGAWLYKPVLKGNMILAPNRFHEIEKDVRLKSQDEIDAWLKEYCTRFETDVVTCYCNSCYQGLTQGMAQQTLNDTKKIHVKHLAQLLFP